MKHSLVIVQDVPTQFDVPLYNIIAEQQPFSLFVIYTQAPAQDDEIGRKPIWDHIEKHCYEHLFLCDSKLASVSDICNEIQLHHPDHVVISGYWPKLHRDIMRCLTQNNVSVGLRSDNTLRHTKLGGLQGKIKRAYLKRLLAKYSVWHPVGSQAEHYLRSLSGEPRPVSYFPYTADNDWFKEHVLSHRVNRSSYLSQLGFPEHSQIILGIMKWSEREDPMTLVAAFEAYQSQQPNSRLILVGDGPLRDTVMAATKPIKNLIYTPGYVSYSQLPKWYSLADVFVHPAPSEPWGVSVNEALASGVPVIASTGVGAAVELIEEGMSGFIFEQRDVQSLVTALKKWAQMKNSRTNEDIQTQCQLALAKWNYETVISAFQNILKNVRR